MSATFRELISAAVTAIVEEKISLVVTNMQKVVSGVRERVDSLKARADGIKTTASESATHALGLSRRIIYTTVISTITVGLMANASAFMYATFYYAFVPAAEHEGPLNPIFEPCGPKARLRLVQKRLFTEEDTEPKCGGRLFGIPVLSTGNGPILMHRTKVTRLVRLVWHNTLR